MSAKVIGFDPSATKRVTCRNCAAIVEYTGSDCREKKHSHDYLGDYEIGNFVQCPNCGQDILVKP